MVNKQQIPTIHPASQLERFSLAFEYDKTISEVKREVRVRTFKSL